MQVAHRVELSISLVTTSSEGHNLPFEVLGVRMCESDVHFPCVSSWHCANIQGQFIPTLINNEHGKDKNGLLRHILINVIKKVHITKLKLGPQI